MSDKELKSLIQKWKQRDGEHIVKSKLIAQRLSSSLVEKICANRYPGELRGANRTVIEDELKTAGILSKEKAG